MKKIFIILFILLLSTNLYAQGMPPPTVVVTNPKIQDISEKYEFLGTTEAVESVDIIARVEGYLEKEHFAEGKAVKKGDLLYTIQNTKYDALVKQAKANLIKAKAIKTQTYLEYKRNKTLSQKDVVSKSRFEQTEAEYESAKANVIASEALLKTAKLDLSYTKIKSPINGRIGISKVSTGDLLSPNNGLLTNVNNLDTMRVVFSISENFLFDIKKRYKGKSQEEVYALFTPYIVLPNGYKYEQSGKIEFFDNQVNPSTGTIEVRALFDNPDNFLIPGQFVKIQIRQGDNREAIVIPAETLQLDKQGYFVVKVDDNGTTSKAPVKIGVKEKGYAEVKAGLTLEDRIVLQGVQKVRLGGKVNF